MIISHKYKFIFIKAEKVAGTSIEIALAKHCGEQDIITNISEYNPQYDDTKYKQQSRNYKGLGYYNHIPPTEIKEIIGKDIWDNYFKFAITRNPWDKAVSDYFYKLPKKHITKKNISSNLLKPKAYKYILKKILLSIKKLFGFQASDFELYIMSLKKNSTNAKFYFDNDGKPICDFYIRYEYLDRDYKKVCEQLGIPNERLPKTKSKLRKERKHYSQYFTKKTKEKIESISREEIDYFDYVYKRKKH